MKAAAWRGCEALHPGGWIHGKTTTEITAIIAEKAAPADRRGIKTMLALLLWQIWLERNSCTFRGKEPWVDDVIAASRSTLEQWRLAGAKFIESPFGDVT